MLKYQVIMVFIGLLLLAIVGLVLWVVYMASKGDRKKERVPPLARGSSIIDTEEYGSCSVIKIEELTPNKSRITLRDVYGSTHIITPHYDEIDMCNVWQCLAGPHNPRFRYVHSDARLKESLIHHTETKRERNRLRETAVKAQQDAEENQSNAKLAHTNMEIQIQKVIDQQSQLSKASSRPKETKR